MKHTISALVENEFGVLTRVAGLFSGRGFNIQSLTVAETLNPKVSRMTLTTSGSEETVEQIIKQLDKLVNVIAVQDLTGEKVVNRIISLVKVLLTHKNRYEVMKTVELLGAEILDADAECCIVEVRGDEEKIKSALNLLKPYGVIEFDQSGSIAMQRGKEVML